MDATRLGNSAARLRTKLAFGDTGSGGVTGGSLAKPSGGGGASLSSNALQAPAMPKASPGAGGGGAWFDNADQAYGAHNNNIAGAGKAMNAAGGWTDPDPNSWRNGSWNPTKWDWFSGGKGVQQQGALNQMQSNSQVGQGLMNNFMSNPQAHSQQMMQNPLGALGFGAMLPGGLDSIQNIISGKQAPTPSELGQQAATQAEQPGFFGRTWNGVKNVATHAGGLAKGAIGTVAGGIGLAGAGISGLAGKAYEGITGDANNFGNNFAQSLGRDSLDLAKGGIRDVGGNAVNLVGDAMYNVSTINPFDDNAKSDATVNKIHEYGKGVAGGGVQAVQDRGNAELRNSRDMAWAAPVQSGLNTIANTAAEAIPGTMVGGGTMGNGLIARGAQMGGTGGRVLQGAGHVGNIAGQIATGGQSGVGSLALESGIKMLNPPAPPTPTAPSPATALGQQAGKVRTPNMAAGLR